MLSLKPPYTVYTYFLQLKKPAFKQAFSNSFIYLVTVYFCRFSKLIIVWTDIIQPLLPTASSTMRPL